MLKFNEKIKKTMYQSIEKSERLSINKEHKISFDYIKPMIPEGEWQICSKCKEIVYIQDVIENNYICPKCGYYLRIGAKKRIDMILDKGSYAELFCDLEKRNPINYSGYIEKLTSLQEKTNLDEAIIIVKGKLKTKDVIVGVCDTQFIMGSMGYVVGEKITRAFELAMAESLPVILFCSSGGARMQEGVVSLMQMAKTAAVINRHSKKGLLYISVLTDPTMGGVTASFAMLGDIILAEPQALIGFAGPRVIAQTINQKLPAGFQRSEMLLEKGVIDRIVERNCMRNLLSDLLEFHNCTDVQEIKQDDTIIKMEPAVMNCSGISAWDRVKISRRAERPTTINYINVIFDRFIELHGDRCLRDDGAIIGGIAWLNNIPVTLIGHQKGTCMKENQNRNFGMASPEGYRKALRLMKQAEKFHRPIITFIDTPGAACDKYAEEHGQGSAIANNLYEMAALKVPVLSILIGEGGSGGALGLAVANEVWAMENSTYSIISPEGFASILWKDASRAKEAAEIMSMTSEKLLELGIINQIIPEPQPFTQDSLGEIAASLKSYIWKFLTEYSYLSEEEIMIKRYHYFRNM
nr:acetyl-CoA carboxylase carboxyltransferase subunit alpha [uncultured Clostridium sp.]